MRLRSGRRRPAWAGRSKRLLEHGDDLGRGEIAGRPINQTAESNPLMESHALRVWRLDIHFACKALVAVLHGDARGLVIEGAANSLALGEFGDGDAVDVEVMVEFRFEPSIVVARVFRAGADKDEEAAWAPVQLSHQHAMRPS